MSHRNLDPSTFVGIGVAQVRPHQRRGKTTVVMATHDDEIVDQMRKRVIGFAGGEVARPGPRRLRRLGPLKEKNCETGVSSVGDRHGYVPEPAMTVSVILVASCRCFHQPAAARAEPDLDHEGRLVRQGRGLGSHVPQVSGLSSANWVPMARPLLRSARSRTSSPAAPPPATSSPGSDGDQGPGLVRTSAKAYAKSAAAVGRNATRT